MSNNESLANVDCLTTILLWGTSLIACAGDFDVLTLGTWRKWFVTVFDCIYMLLISYEKALLSKRACATHPPSEPTKVVWHRKEPLCPIIPWSSPRPSPQLKAVDSTEVSDSRVLAMGHEKSQQCLLIKAISRMTVMEGNFTLRDQTSMRFSRLGWLVRLVKIQLLDKCGSATEVV